MRNAKLVLAASAVSLLLGTAAYAGEKSAGGSYSSGSSATHSHDEGSSGSSASLSGANIKGEHSMGGKITDIDRDKGQITVKTKDAGDLKLHFPPSSLANLDEGDQITVHLGFSAQGAGAASTREGGGSSSGTVSSDRGESSR